MINNLYSTRLKQTKQSIEVKKLFSVVTWPGKAVVEQENNNNKTNKTKQLSDF